MGERFRHVNKYLPVIKATYMSGVAILNNATICFSTPVLEQSASFIWRHPLLSKRIGSGVLT